MRLDYLRRSCILIVLACYGGGSASAQTGAVANGSFETDYSSWATHTGNQGVVAVGPPYATNGVKAVRFNAGQTAPNGVLSQSFATTAGQTYALAFDIGAVSMMNQDAQRVQVTVQGAATRLSQAATVNASGVGVRFVRQNFTFVADSATTTLRFQDTSPTTMNVDLYLDNVAVTLGGSGSLPSPLKAVDIGGPAIAGSTSYAGGVFTISAGGADIWSTSDQFHYVYQPVTGDVEIIARASSITAANPWSKLGVMIRESLAANSRHATAFASAASGYAFQRRIDPGGFSTSSGAATGVPPAWVRLVRTGSRFEAFRSTNGTAWTSMGFDTIPMGNAVFVGLAATSRIVSAATTVRVDGLKITPISSTGNKLPTVALTAPATGANFTAPATIALTATASDPESRLSRVEFYSGATRIGSVTAAPFSMTWPSVAAGTYSLTAMAIDLDGGSATSPVATVSVRAPTNQLPTVALTAPVAGASIAAPATVTLSASATDPESRMARVEFYAGTTLVGTDASAPYSVPWSPTTAGAYALKAIAFDMDNGSTSSTTVNVTVTTASTTPGVCPCTIWKPSATPVNTATSDTSAVELGVRFRSDVNGTITGGRFYKAATNTGTHIASLWTNTGTLLARATFTNETASGWQQVNFATPVAITANTNYVMSYHTDTGHYSYNNAYFATTGMDSPPLHALATTVGTNGVYKYGGNAFPDQTYQGQNYWVDVVFSASGSTTPPPTTVPKRVVFGASADHATTLVTNYLLEIYANGANPQTATPVASSNLAKPAPAANGDIDVDRATFFAALPVGTYVASVSAVGPGGKSRSAPVTFTR